MFTGLIQDIGELKSREAGRFRIACHSPADSIALGASIACDGCCLTAIRIVKAGEGAEFDVDVSNETLDVTTLGAWQPGRKINLERSLRVGDELGGHLVSGHVDGLAKIVSITPDGDSRRFVFEAPQELARYIAAKGSVALNGVSLTVNEVAGSQFGVNLIPFTLSHTTFQHLSASDLVNLEVDRLARYAERLSGADVQASGTAPKILQAAG
ncbi:riboflavin synthase [Methyloligella sp. 2.7D]|uniref:riboflavin synthase n=1 Tax=unclassified Methyloligella TaxID=2625955 RepID=UPI00157CF4D5|nr:riboflavin synthase [Methyloligella sp. GL2]QKP77596.1 riboflavin synthase [Methyloligella sp. GL2]